MADRPSRPRRRPDRLGLVDYSAQRQQQPVAPEQPQLPGEEPARISNMDNNNANDANADADATNARILTLLQQVVADLASRQNDLTNAISSLIPARTTSFHLSPAQSDLDNLLDLTSRAGRSIYEETLRGESSKYDLSKSGLVPFIDSIAKAADRLGCASGRTSVCHYTPSDTAAAVNIIREYGKLTNERVKDLCQDITSGANKDTRKAQNNSLILNYTLNSLTKDGKKSIMVYQAEFTVDGIQCFGLLWKLIVSFPSIDNKSTARNLRTEIRAMPKEITSMKIPPWNEKFTSLCVQLLERRGPDATSLEPMDDTVDIILRAYCASGDYRFDEYWVQKRREIEDNEGSLATADWKTILAKGMEKYNNYKEDWGQLSQQHQNFLALQAKYTKEIEGLRGQLQLTSGTRSQRNKPTKSKDSSKTSTAPSAPQSRQITKNKKPKADRQRQKKDEAWKKLPPKDGEPTSKTVDGWNCHWCIHHMSWCGHKSEDCKLGKARMQAQQGRPKSTSFVASSATVPSSASSDPAVQHQQDFMAKLAGLSRLHE